MFSCGYFGINQVGDAILYSNGLYQSKITVTMKLMTPDFNSKEDCIQ